MQNLEEIRSIVEGVTAWNANKQIFLIAPLTDGVFKLRAMTPKDKNMYNIPQGEVRFGFNKVNGSRHKQWNSVRGKLRDVLDINLQLPKSSVRMFAAHGVVAYEDLLELAKKA